MQIENVFIHHVFFWLNESNESNRAQLIEGLKKLSSAAIIKNFHIGLPADTHRDVVQNNYDVSWMLFFNNPEEQEQYQVDPVHLDFVKECSHLWQKVMVYDSVNA